MHTTEEVGGAPKSKHNPYAEAANPDRYRVADAPLFTCAAHSEACVLCTTAGKNGRNGRTAAVGATLFWLTCPHLNALIARLEGHRCVQAVAEAMRRHPRFMACHVDSHEAYVRRAKDLLTEAQWSFFTAHFLTNENVQLRKFGNAAVSHAEDMKCLHALVAQTLAGAVNLVGSLVVNYVLFLHDLTLLAEGVVARNDDSRAELRAALDSTALFINFMEAAVISVAERESANGTRFAVALPEPSVFEVSSVTHTWHADASFPSLLPDICAQALRVLVFLEGKPPRRNKKHRIN